MPEEFLVRYRDTAGLEVLSSPSLSISGAIRLARHLEASGDEIIGVVGPEGVTIRWCQLAPPAEAAARVKPPTK